MLMKNIELARPNAFAYTYKGSVSSSSLPPMFQNRPKQVMETKIEITMRPISAAGFLDKPIKFL